jgi:hypothetical protein
MANSGGGVIVTVFDISTTYHRKYKILYIFYGMLFLYVVVKFLIPLFFL